MDWRYRSHLNAASRPACFLSLILASVVALAAAGCGAGVDVEGGFNRGTGTVSLTISDPPPCRFPLGDFKNVWVTVRSVQAHVSASAGDNSGGWVELAPNLASAPRQIDLMATPANGCTLASLGVTEVPVGAYQQIRLILLANNPPAGAATPSPNACAGQGFNCAVLGDDSVRRLELSSQDITGLKIPPGQIVGGPITVAEGQTIDLNIDFNTCASIVRQGNGQLRLRPALTAGQVSSVSTGLSGTVVDAATMQPIDGTVHVAVQQADNAGIGRIVMQAVAGANGAFNFCPLPTGTYDVVAVGVSGGGVAYGASAVLGAPAGSNLGMIPLIGETAAPPAGPAAIEGQVTSTTGSAGVSVDVAFAALQTIEVSGVTRHLNIPLQGESTLAVATEAGGACPANTHCAAYMLVVPPFNPSFRTFSGTSFSTPAAGDVLFRVEGRAFVPMSGGTAACSPSAVIVNADAADMPLKVAAGMATTAKRMEFTGCAP